MHEPLTIIWTLVHGTFASRAPWTQEGSSLRQTLRDAFEPANSIFQTPQWSSLNAQGRRLEAAESLRQEFRQTRINFPTAKHFVIAHSHGGNVARHALEEGDMRECVDGLITLNTPFIDALKRDEDSIVTTLRITFGSAIGAVFANAVWPVYGTPFAIATAALGFTALVSCALLERFLRKKGRTPRSVVGDELRRALNGVHYTETYVSVPEEFSESLRPGIPVPLLCLASAADEAISGLAFLEGLANAPHILFHRSLLPAVWASSMILLAVGGGTAFFFDLNLPGWLLGAVVLLPWGLFALMGVSLVACALLRLAPLGFPITLRAMAEDLLEHRWVVSYVPLSTMFVRFEDYRPSLMEVPYGNLLHSSIYESDFALTCIQLWAKDIADWKSSETEPAVVMTHIRPST